MDDWFFPVFALVAVTGGAIRAAMARNRKGVSEAAAVETSGSVEMEPPTLRKNYGSPDQRIWRFMLIVPVVLMLLALLASDYWTIALATVPLAVGALRFSQGGVFPTQSGLKIVNLLSTRELAWGEIDHFEVLDYPSATRAVLKDGTSFGVTALQPGNPLLTGTDKGHAERVHDLNRLVTFKQRQTK